MNATQFKSLKYGNVIARDADGAKFTVLHTTRNAEGVISAAILPAIQEKDAEGFSVIGTETSETVLQGRTILGE